MKSVLEFVRTHPARLYAAVAALAVLLPPVHGALVVGVVGALLGVGEAVQRTENAKTAEALAAPDPESMGH